MHDQVDMLQVLLAQLQAAGFPITEVYPDEKVHRFVSSTEGDPGTSAWFVCGQNSASKTGQTFYTVLWGDTHRGIINEHFTTLVSPTKADKVAIKGRLQAFERQEIKERNDSGVKVASAVYAVMDHMDKQRAAAKKERREPTDAPDGMYVSALGHLENDYYFTTSENLQITRISQFSENALLNLMPVEYWESQFPGAGASRVDWTQARSNLMAQARKCGIFQDERVRGAGVWVDEGRIIVNMGDRLIEGGQEHHLQGLETDYFYTLGVKLPRLSPIKMELDECETLLDACEKFKWQKPHQGILLAGALVTSRICGALPIRPHIWVTGGANTGKTTILRDLINPIIGKSVIRAVGNTTEAGLRQKLKHDATPILFDEFETNGRQSADRIQTIVDLMRVAWSHADGAIIKGGATGTATSTVVTFSAIVLSIRPALNMDADKGRFALLELAPHGSDPKHYQELCDLLEKIDDHYANKLFARTISMIPTLLDNFKTLKRVLSRKAGQRFGDQYGMLLAGASILAQDEPMTEAHAEAMVDLLELADEQVEAREADHTDCLAHILTKKLSLDLGKSVKEDRTVGEIIYHVAAVDLPNYRDALERYGLSAQIEGNKVILYVQSSHPQLSEIVFNGTQWAKGVWAKSLRRLPGAGSTTWRFFKSPAACVKIPLPDKTN